MFTERSLFSHKQHSRTRKYFNTFSTFGEIYLITSQVKTLKECARRNRLVDWFPLQACSILLHSGPRRYFLLASHDGMLGVAGYQTCVLNSHRREHSSNLQPLWSLLTPVKIK